nr:F-box domain [Pandoravirus massiliensis]
MTTPCLLVGEESRRPLAAPWLTLPDELTLLVLVACDCATAVANARLVCREWARVGADAMGSVAKSWAASLVSVRVPGCDPADVARTAVYSAVALDKPRRLALLLGALPAFDLAAPVTYRPTIEARGYARLTGLDRPTRFDAPRPTQPFYAPHVPPAQGLLPFAVGCGAVRCAQALAAAGAPAGSAGIESLVWAALWAATRSWHLCVYDPGSYRDQDSTWRTIQRLPAVDGLALVETVLALPASKPVDGRVCVHPVQALCIATVNATDDTKAFWHDRRDEMTAWACSVAARISRARRSDAHRAHDHQYLVKTRERAPLNARPFFDALIDVMEEIHAGAGGGAANATNTPSPA